MTSLMAKPPKSGEYYPGGPCECPMVCSVCGELIETWADALDRPCDDENCETCLYCGSLKCPGCGDHLHCGGCV